MALCQRIQFNGNRFRICQNRTKRERKTEFIWGVNDPPAQTAMIGRNRYEMMQNKHNPKTDPSQAMVYQIRIEGHLGRPWTGWFGGLTITLEENGDTLLTGPVVEQAALHALLRKVRDLGMPLLSVCAIEPG